MPAPAPITICYGTSTGNSRRLAEQAAAHLEAEKIAVALVDLEQFPAEKLAEQKRVAIVIGTWGDGEPPDAARAFCEKIFRGHLPKLPQMEYCVLALGDSCFPNFCGCGKKVDECLARLGARRLLDCQMLDTTAHADFRTWCAQLLQRVAASAAKTSRAA